MTREAARDLTMPCEGCGYRHHVFMPDLRLELHCPDCGREPLFNEYPPEAVRFAGQVILAEAIRASRREGESL